MAAQDDPRMRRVLKRLDAYSMLSNVFEFPELKDAADDYDSLVNMTIREAQPTLNNDEDWTLPLNEVRKLFTVYWHLNFLRIRVAEHDPEVAKVWQQKQKRYLDKWKELLKSKNYPNRIMKTFKEHGCRIMPSGVEQSLCEALKPPYGGIQITVCWHLAFLCNDLQELGEIEEKQLWESEQSLYLPSEENERMLHRELAQSYAAYARRFTNSFEYKERGNVELREYYIKGFRKDQSEQLAMTDRALEYLQNYEASEQE